jgi:hypothetical protein
MLRRNFAKLLPATIIAPSLLSPSTAKASWPSNLEIANLCFVNLKRDELPLVVGHQCHVEQPDGTLLSNNFWHHSLLDANDSVITQSKGVSFRETDTTLDQLRDLVREHGAPTFELRIPFDEGLAYSFVPEAEVHDILNRLREREPFPILWVGRRAKHLLRKDFATCEGESIQWHLVERDGSISSTFPWTLGGDGSAISLGTTISEVRTHLGRLEGRPRPEIHVMCKDGRLCAFVRPEHWRAALDKVLALL